ncbi:class I SAM-dependent DNA methyltransferase [Halomicrobium urmianum]|uniref:class I SAM-dependent DNA methyltransferase n=1 Tax=Halomicrobium urmianum TaxID=1586233 RepID=UPI001CDA4817|nr:class I SAM-dependent methyltransferase [Halomicrobium urmianum]
MARDGYRGTAARFYDVHAREFDRDGAAFYRRLASDADGPALELACGTGRVYLDLLRSGVDVDGLDRSADALSVLRENVDADGRSPTVWQADMTDFAVDREYALVYCPFNAVQHALTVGDQLALFRCVSDALAPGGRFVFDVFVPSFEVICEEYGDWETKSVRFDGEPHEFRTRTRIVDEVEQRFEVTNELRDADGNHLFEESFPLALLPKPHVGLLARLSPFDDWHVDGGFGGEPIADGDETQVWTLETAE